MASSPLPTPLPLSLSLSLSLSLGATHVFGDGAGVGEHGAAMREERQGREQRVYTLVQAVGPEPGPNDELGHGGPGEDVQRPGHRRAGQAAAVGAQPDGMFVTRAHQRHEDDVLSLQIVVLGGGDKSPIYSI